MPMAAASKPAHRFAQLAICHAAKIVFKDVVTLKRVYITSLELLCLHMSDSCFVCTHSFLPSFITPLQSVDQVHCSGHSMAALQAAQSWDDLHHVNEGPTHCRSSLTCSIKKKAYSERMRGAAIFVPLGRGAVEAGRARRRLDAVEAAPGLEVLERSAQASAQRIPRRLSAVRGEGWVVLQLPDACPENCVETNCSSALGSAIQATPSDPLSKGFANRVPQAAPSSIEMILPRREAN